MHFTWGNLLSWILVTSVPCYAIMNPPMVLRNSQTDIVERNEMTEQLKPMISCVETIADKSFFNKDRVSVLIPNFFQNEALSKLFFTGLHKQVATFSITENTGTFEAYQKANNAVIVIRNSTDLNLLGNMTLLCGPRCRYVICLLTFYEDEKSFLTEADAVVDGLWKSWVITAVIVASAGGEFLVAGSYSFQSNDARVPKNAEILGKCDTLWKKSDQEIFHKLLMNNCRINVTVSYCKPFVQGIVEEQGKRFLTGIEGEMFETIAKSLHMSLNILNLSLVADANETMYDYLVSILDDPDGSDVAFCGLYTDVYEKVEYSSTYESQELVWLVPSLPALSISGLITPLDNVVWFAIIGLLFIAGIMKVLCFPNLSFLGVLGLILGVALPKQPTILSSRIQFASWVLFGYIITQSYLASLAGQLMNVDFQMIDTQAELEASGIAMGGTDRHKDLFQDEDDLEAQRIYEKYITINPTEYKKLLHDVRVGKNTSIALVKEIKVSRTKYYGHPNGAHRLRESLARYPISIAVWKGLPYLDQINSIVAHLVQAGIVNFWSENYTKRNTSNMIETSKGFRKLDTLHLSPSFLMLLIGHGFSLLVFFIEIGVYAKQRHRLMKKRNNRVAKSSDKFYIGLESNRRKA